MRLAKLSFLLIGTIAHADPIMEVSPQNGFIDDGFALSADGTKLAYVVTDGASTADLYTVTIGAKAAPQKVAHVSPNASEVHFAGNKIVVVSRDGKSSAIAYGAGGAQGPRIAAADEIVIGKIGNAPALFAYNHSERGKSAEHVVTGYRLDTLSQAVRQSYRESDGLITHAGAHLRPMWWQDGFGTMATLRSGEYDKGHDIRTPDEFALLDLQSGKLRDQHPVEDLMAFTHIASDHKARREVAFAHISEDRAKLMMVDGLRESELKLPRPVSMYQPETLRTQMTDDLLWLSLTTDPVNPDALQRQKADPEIFELYSVDRATGAMTPRFKTPAAGRRTAWQVGGKRVAVLRKSKGFDRGGVKIEIFDLK